MKKDYYFFLALFFPVAALQMVVAPMISIGFIRPDFLLLMIVFFSLKYGQIPGTSFGFVCGFLFDLVSGGLVGSAMFSKTLSGFIAGYFYDENEMSNQNTLVKVSLIVLLCASIDSFFYSALGTTEVIGLRKLLVEMSVLSGLYTTIISLPFIIFNPLKVIP